MIAHIYDLGDVVARWEAEKGQSLEAYSPARLVYVMVNHKGPCLKPGEGQGSTRTCTPAHLHIYTDTHTHIYAGTHM